MYKIRIREIDYNKLKNHLFKRNIEEIAYIFCNRGEYEEEKVFIVKDIYYPNDSEVEENSRNFVIHKYKTLEKIRNIAFDNEYSLFCVHSHIETEAIFSEDDNLAAAPLLKELVLSNSNQHGQIVMDKDENLSMRLLNKDLSSFEHINDILIVGETVIKKISFSFNDSVLHDYYNRQVMIFGSKRQKLLKHFKIGIIGSGGNGSAIAEQLTRIGIGKIVLVDHDKIEDSNISRIYGSTKSDVGKYKTEVLKLHLENIRNDILVDSVNENVFSKNSVNKLKMCDFIICATDQNEIGRFISQRINYYYMIPIIDFGIKVNYNKSLKLLEDVDLRVDYCYPDSFCLYDLGTINLTDLNNDLLYFSDQATHARLVREGYAIGMNVKNPAVISYNSYASSFVVSIFIRLLMGKHSFSQINRRIYDVNFASEIKEIGVCSCSMCSKTEKYLGDVSDLLGIYSWRETNE